MPTSMAFIFDKFDLEKKIIQGRLISDHIENESWADKDFKRGRWIAEWECTVKISINRIKNSLLGDQIEGWCILFEKLTKCGA